MPADNRTQSIAVLVGADAASRFCGIAEASADARDADSRILNVGPRITDDIVLKGKTGVIHVAMEDMNLAHIEISEYTGIRIEESTHGCSPIRIR